MSKIMDTKEMKENLPAVAGEGEIVLFNSQDGKVRLDVQANGGNVWLRQEQIADLFSKDRTVVGRHIAKIFREGELDAESNVQKMHIPFSDKPVAFYSLDVVLAVGYKAESRRAVEFRRWATSILKDYLVKGFSIDSERLKGNGGGQYWYELLNTIKDIRSSEKVLAEAMSVVLYPDKELTEEKYEYLDDKYFQYDLKRKQELGLWRVREVLR